MSDPSDVDAALVSLLAADATLTGYMPDGVFVDIAPNSKTKFVIVSLVAHNDNYMFGGEAYEQSVYLVKAVDNATSGVTVKSAAARIQALLQDAILSVTGYAASPISRDERIRYTEVDDINQDIRWQHRGGHYSVLMSPASA